MLGGQRVAYFDNAATTYPKPDSVYLYMNEYYRSNGASFGRGNHKAAISASELVNDTRRRIQELLHCPAKQVVFTPSATIALNIIIQGLVRKGLKHFYISPFEHNAVTRVLHSYQEQGVIDVQTIIVDKSMKYDLRKIELQFQGKAPDVLIMSHASNVCGLIAPVEEISVLAKKYGATVVIDMSQTAGLVDCNTGLETIDYAVFAGHKTLYGPTGISGFVMKKSAVLPPILFGGTGFESANQNMPEDIPERFEVGTQNILGIAGLNAALKWIENTTLEGIREREESNRKKLLELLEKYSFIKVIGNNPECCYVGIVATLIDEISSDSAGSVFDRCGIAVRTGLQCAPAAHRFLGTFPAGTIRFSVCYFTDNNDFSQLAQALDYIDENI